MAKEVLVKLICDSTLCDTKLVLPADAQLLTESQSKEAAAWVQVVRANGNVEQYCRATCAINGLNGHGPHRGESAITLTDAPEVTKAVGVAA